MQPARNLPLTRIKPQKPEAKVVQEWLKNNNADVLESSRVQSTNLVGKCYIGSL